MKKLFIILLLASLTSAHAYQYWWLDVSVRGSIQRVYFFKTLSAFEEASGISYRSLDWIESNSNLNTSYQTIFGTMRKENLVAAFVMAEYSPNWGPSHPYSYQFYLISNNKTYVAVSMLSRQIQMRN